MGRRLHFLLAGDYFGIISENFVKSARAAERRHQRIPIGLVIFTLFLCIYQSEIARFGYDPQVTYTYRFFPRFLDISERLLIRR